MSALVDELFGDSGATVDPISAPSEQLVVEPSTPEICTNEVTVPSGLTIRYESGPKRRYLIGETELPSVTTITDCLAKDLSWWGMQIGVAGTLELLANGLVETGVDGAFVHWPSAPEVVDLLTANKLTVNHVRDKAGDRGTSVHRALEDWARDPRLMPDPEQYPESERGYVRGVIEFLQAANPTPGRSEMMVASAEHAYAGRFDLTALLPGCELVKRRTPTGRLTHVKVAPGSWLLDLKTSKGIYPTHHLQLAGYRLALVECGYNAPVGEAVLHVTPDGHYEFIPGEAQAEDFVAVRACYEAMVGLKARTAVRKKAAA